MSAPNSIPNLKTNPFLVEVVHDVSEFRSLVRGRCRYEMRINGDGSGIRFYITLKVYGVSTDGHIVVLELLKKVDGLSLGSDKSIDEAVKDAIRELEAIAKSLGARPGRFEVGMK